MRIEQLQQFISVAHHGNFRKASRELGISQPALSRSIKNLEEYFSVPLFDRLSSGIVLTEYGRSVLEWAQEIVSSSQNIKRYVDLLSESSAGTLMVGAGTYFTDSILATSLSKVLDRHPALKVTVIRESGKNAENMLLNRDIDLYLGWMEPGNTTGDVFTQKLDTGTIAHFCRKGHPILNAENIDLPMILEYPYIAPTIPEELRIMADNYIYELTGEKRPLIDIEFDSYSEIRRVIEKSDCIGGLPESAMGPYLGDNSIFERLPVSIAGIRGRAGISFLKNTTLLPAAESLIKELNSEFVKRGVKLI